MLRLARSGTGVAPVALPAVLSEIVLFLELVERVADLEKLASGVEAFKKQVSKSAEREGKGDDPQAHS